MVDVRAQTSLMVTSHIPPSPAPPTYAPAYSPSGAQGEAMRAPTTWGVVTLG
jgi:hypothetical protein